MDFFLLRLDQIKGDNCLSIFKKMGYSADYTDFAFLLGGKYGKWWTMTPDYYGPIAIGRNNYSECEASRNIQVGVRPAVKYSAIAQFCKNKRQNAFGVTEVEFGEYPSTVFDDNDNDSLIASYYANRIPLTGKVYRIANPVVGYGQTDVRTYPEFDYKGGKIIEITSSTIETDDLLTNGNNVRRGYPYFLKIEPIVWLVDEEADLAISKNIVFAGVKFNAMSGYYSFEEFDESFMKRFLNEFFVEDIRTPEMLAFDKENSNRKKM